jgi:hypothetical protein
MQDVANRLIKDFAGCLQQKLQQPGGAEPQEPAATADLPKTGGGRTPGTVDEAGAEEAQAAAAASAAQPTTGGGRTAGAVDQAQAPATAPSAFLSPGSTEAPSAAARAPSELKIQDLLISVLRSRTAAGLRRLAELVEPK